ncbi:MAG: phosphatidylserine decarboxylase family protein [Candidatus Hydrogenedentes bacterium]|nr:phosphatidylserine decarboxylase family protein [Candidatus Hydrogenedentota bacterium]
MKAKFSAFNEAFPYYGGLMVMTIVFLIVAQFYPLAYTIAVVFIIFKLYTLYFFRDPKRTITTDASAIVSPADGTIVAIEDFTDSPHYEGPCKRVSIFLSIFNVHINRSPFEGTVESITYKPGQFLDARKSDTSELNEANTIRMTTPKGPMTVRQISGLIARRIICKVEVGETLAKGEKFGMIKFGSRTELYLPVDAQICVTLKDKVQGGATIVARFPD